MPSANRCSTGSGRRRSDFYLGFDLQATDIRGRLENVSVERAGQELVRHPDEGIVKSTAERLDRRAFARGNARAGQTG